MTDLELLSIGDATWDVFVTPSESETFCEVNTEDEMIAFKFGDKIPVRSMEYSIGGNAANNAVGTRRLGIKSAPLVTLGDDSIANQIAEKFVTEGVDTSYVFRQKNSGTNYSTVIVAGGERTIFTYKHPRDYQLPLEFPKVSWAYLTSLGDNFEDVYQKVAEWIQKNPEIKLAFNPGSRQVRAGLEKIKNVLAVSYAIYINRKEAEEITGQTNTKGKERELLTAVSQLGPRLSIITDGPEGSFAYDGDKFYKAGIVKLSSYERTGAGDSFGSGCIAALIKGKPLGEAILWGTVNSASVIGYAGAQRGLLKVEEIDKWLMMAKGNGVVVEEF